MTDTTTTTHEEAETVTEHAHGELSHIDPNSLEVGENVREYANVDKPFLDSIAEHGVLVPITAIRRHDGVIEIRAGSLSSSRVVVDPCGAAECCRGCDRTR
jgi:ParB family chromosome partitioning protein